ncbi:MAG: hypothetical protein KatS3mg076_3153 [Candidatus Binatia bacterium]|nr:MAG: hypothetical protein KatS3mg076_3153 [Candidatus Binatia bacterium]
MLRARQLCVLWALGWFLCPAGRLAAAQETAPPEVVLEARTPQSAMHAYLEAARAGDWEKAAEFLDTRALPPAVRKLPPTTLARQLKVVLDRTLWVDLGALSDEPEGFRDDGLPKNRDLVGTITLDKKKVPVLLERLPGPEGTRVWRISSATVAQIPTLYEAFGYGKLGEILPPLFFEFRLAEVQLWQWIALLGLVVLSAVFSWILTVAVFRLLQTIVARSKTEIDDRLLALAASPFRLLVAVALFALGTAPLGLALPVERTLGGLEKALAIVAVTWLLARLVDLLAQAAQDRLTARGQTLALSVLPLGRRVVKVLVVFLALLAALQNFGINVTGVLAGLGIGGLAVALAAQKTVENVFGGLTLILDQPVRVGDFCRFGDRVGTVEDVGLRSTRIRTLDRTVVTIPNADFSGMQLENFARRDRIWYHPKIGLRYETSPDQLRYVLVEIKKMLVAHPKVEKDPARIRFVGFGACSLDLEIFAYIRTNDYNEFLAIQEDLNLRIMDIVAASGTGFAFPSQTAYLATDSGLDVERTERAVRQVREWKARKALALPNLPPEELARLADTLDYPPEGSALRG